MIGQGEVVDGEATNGGNEGGTSESIVHNTCTTVVGPTSEESIIRETREPIKNHPIRRLTKLEKVVTVTHKRPLGILREVLKAKAGRVFC